MLGIALAATAQLSLPVPVGNKSPDVRAIFTADDFPAYLQMEGVSREVHTRTTVRPDGTIESCLVEGTSGDRKLDAYTCAIILKRARLLPARWIDGTPTYGVIRMPVSWRVANSPPTEAEMLRSAEPDVDLSVNHLPKGAGSMAAVNVEIAVDTNGRAVSCEEAPTPSITPRKRFPELVELACQTVTKEYTAVPPVDSLGKPVRSIQTVSVRFSKSR